MLREPCVVGSNPTSSPTFMRGVAQWVEQRKMLKNALSIKKDIHFSLYI